MEKKKPVKRTEKSRTVSNLPDAKLVFRLVPISRIRRPDNLSVPGSGSGTPVDLALPLVLCRISGKSGYYVIDGCKRLERFKKRKSKSVPCAVLTGELDENELALMRFSLNRGRTLPIDEKISWLKWISGIRDTKARNRALEDIGCTVQDLANYSAVFSSGREITVAVEAGIIHPSLVRIMLLWTELDRKAFLTAFKGANLSFQTQREFLEWLTDMVFSAKTLVREILSQTDIKSVLENQRMNWPQKIEKIREQLFLKRFPRLAEAKNLWKKIAASSNPDPARIRFIPEANFEKNRLEVRCSIKKPEEAAALFMKLAQIPEQTWKTLIYPV
jgi:hypothetical protein